VRELVNWFEKIAAEHPRATVVLRAEERGVRIVIWRPLQTGLSACTIRPAETRRVTGKVDAETVARPRWQRGWLLKVGKRNPMWVARFREDAIADDGSRLRRQPSLRLGPVSELSKREAQRLISQRLSAINQGRHKPERMIEFERFVLEFFEPSIYPTLRYSTQVNYRYVIRRHLLPFFGKMRLPEIASYDVQNFLAEKSKRIAPRTVLSLRNRLLKIFGTAQRWGYLQSNPAKGAQIPALVDTRERLTLSPQQVRALLGELVEPFRTMVFLAVLSGLRRGELLGLRWKSVDFVDGSISVVESNYHGRSSQPKTRASRRKVFVDSVVVEDLTRLRPSNTQPDDLVFHTERGTVLNPDNIRNRVLIPACRRAGIPIVSWHNFRYTYSTWADPTGESIKALQAQLGHTDSRLTLGVYTQPMPASQREMASKIARVLLPFAPKLDEEEETQDVKPTRLQ
jgi:integrase